MSAALSPERWQRLQQVLDGVLDLPPERQSAALAAACAGDAELLAEARSLLAHRDVLPERLPPEAWQGLADEAAEDSWLGRRIGPFVIEQALGSGGSSTVYRARRADDFDQVVAIKLLRREHDRASLRRFERERGLLARLNHAHIAHLYDAGSTPEGVPYLVLEYVDGRTWDRWLAEENPTLRRRVEQFVLVCDAVEHAHRRLLVHRDIKPANLLVDGHGMPRLLDFGIASLLGDGADSTVTREVGQALTPAYAAPEQLRGEAVTTATDVYALGLVLYETLSGRHPFRRSGTSERELLQAITTRDAARPSQAVQAGPVRAAELRGDLDNIVLSAIEREPARRYGSAQALAADLRAWLAGRPVSARAQTFTYLAGKFIARNRLAVASAFIAVLGLLAAAGIALWQARVAMHERERAQQRFAEVRRFANTVLFDYHEGIQKLAGSLPMQQRLVRDGLSYLEALSQDAHDDAPLWREIAAGYLKVGDLQGNPYGANLGDFAGAARSYDAADAALARVAALGAVDDAETRLWRARLLTRRAHLAYQDSQYAPAREGYAAAVALFEQLAAASPTDNEILLEYTDTLDFYGDLVGRYGQSPTPDGGDARAVQLRAAQLREAALARAPDDIRLRFAVYNSRLREGMHWAGLNDMAKAEAAYADALQRIEALVAIDSSDTYRQREIGVVLTRLAQAQEALGKQDAAIATALRALRHMEGLLAQDPSNDAMRQGVTATAGWAARLLIESGRPAEALPIVQRQIAANEERLRAAPDNPDLLFGLSLGYRRLGQQRAALRDYPGALQAHAKALALQQPLATLSPEYALAVALSQLHIGRTELAAGRVAAARASLSDAAQQLQNLVANQADADAGYREELAEAHAALAEAYTAAPADPARATAARAEAIATWDALEQAGQLTPKAAARRAAVAAKQQNRPAPR